MRSRDLVEEFKTHGAAAHRAHVAVTDAFRAKVRERDPAEYDRLLTTFKLAVERALPTCDVGFLQRLDEGQQDDIERAIAFLEADPFFFTSGYAKQQMIHRLKRVLLNGEQKRWLTTLVLARVDRPNASLFRHYCRLARALRSPTLMAALQDRLMHADVDVRARAARMLEVLKS